MLSEQKLADMKQQQTTKIEEKESTTSILTHSQSERDLVLVPNRADVCLCFFCTNFVHNLE